MQQIYHLEKKNVPTNTKTSFYYDNTYYIILIPIFGYIYPQQGNNNIIFVYRLCKSHFEKTDVDNMLPSCILKLRPSNIF